MGRTHKARISGSELRLPKRKYTAKEVKSRLEISNVNSVGPRAHVQGSLEHYHSAQGGGGFRVAPLSWVLE